MSEEAQNQDANQNPLEQGDTGQQQSAGVPQNEIEGLRKVLADRDRQIQEITARYNTLENRLGEIQGSIQQQPQPQMRQQQPQMEEDFSSVLERIEEGDRAGANKELKRILQTRDQQVVQKLSGDVQALLEIKDRVSELKSQKPWMKNFEGDFQARVGQWIQAGYDYRQALANTEKEYDQKFQGLAMSNQPQASDQQNQDKPKPNPEVQKGAQGNTGQQAVPPPAPQQQAETYEDYIARRQSTRAGKMFKLRG